MHETTYALLDRDARRRRRLPPEGDDLTPSGSVGVLSPSLEYHAFENVGSTTAHTLHVYGGTFESCNVFTQEGNSWWTGSHARLQYDE